MKTYLLDITLFCT